MTRFSLRRLAIAYALAGLALGTAISAWFFGDKPGKQFKHTDGSITTSRFHQESWTDPGTGQVYVVSIPSGRPLPIFDRVGMVLQEGYPILIAFVFLGQCWAFVQAQVRAWLDCPFDEPQALDYEDSTSQNRPPGST